MAETHCYTVACTGPVAFINRLLQLIKFPVGYTALFRPENLLNPAGIFPGTKLPVNGKIPPVEIAQDSQDALRIFKTVIRGIADPFNIGTDLPALDIVHINVAGIDSN